MLTNGNEGSGDAAKEVITEVIELPSLDVINTMIENSQPQCTIGDVVVQNGVTTNQVTYSLCLIDTQIFL